MNHKLPFVLVCVYFLFTVVSNLQADEQLSVNPHDSQWKQLLDRDFSKWEIWMGVPGNKWSEREPLGLGADPKKVFSVIEKDNGELILKISGEIYAGLTSLDTFKDYHFSCEVKFGTKKWPPRLNKPRDSGVLYHASGSHGAFWKVWKRSVEYQVQEGDFGDLYSLAGTAADVRQLRPDKGKPLWDTSQPYSEAGSVSRDRSREYENPPEKWNRVDIIAIGDQSMHFINKSLVLALDNIRHKETGERLESGQIQLQSEGAEVFYKNISIKPADSFPEWAVVKAGLECYR